MADEKKENKPLQQSAIALKYDAPRDQAPKVVATGRGSMAQKIIEMAKEHNIPIHKDPTLVEVLAKLDLGAEIPPELYQVIAEILIFVYRVDQKKGKNQKI